MTESKDIFSIVSSPEGFGYGKHLVYKNDSRIDALVSHGTADGYEAALRATLTDYQIITIDDRDETGATQEWGNNVLIGSLDNLLTTATAADLRVHIAKHMVTHRDDNPEVQYYRLDS